MFTYLFSRSFAFTQHGQWPWFPYSRCVNVATLDEQAVHSTLIPEVYLFSQLTTAKVSSSGDRSIKSWWIIQIRNWCFKRISNHMKLWLIRSIRWNLMILHSLSLWIVFPLDFIRLKKNWCSEIISQCYHLCMSIIFNDDQTRKKNEMVPMRIELMTSALLARRSNQLS